MTKKDLLIVGSLALGFLCGCKTEPAADGSTSASSLDSTPKGTRFTVVVDTVKTERDPKAGWFGSRLQNAYFAHEDRPVVFCSSGPSIPTGRLVTIFTNLRESGPTSVQCNEIVSIVDGEAYWYSGKGRTLAEIAVAKEKEEQLVGKQIEGGLSHHMLRAWANAKPIGEPCADVSGSGTEDVPRQNRGKKCSIIIVDEQHQLYTFVNWTVVGNLDGRQQLDPEHTVLVRDVINRITKSYGTKYLVPEFQGD